MRGPYRASGRATLRAALAIALVGAAAGLLAAMPGGVLGRHVACTDFFVDAPKDGQTYNNDKDFAVTVHIDQVPVDRQLVDRATFSAASLPVAHLWVYDASGAASHYEYPAPVKEDAEPKSGPSPAIAALQFCFVAAAATPPASPSPTPTAKPSATPTAPPTATPTRPPRPTPTSPPPPNATPTAAPTATPTTRPTATPSASPSAGTTQPPPATPAPATSTPTTAPTVPPGATATPTVPPTATSTPTDPQPLASASPTGTPFVGSATPPSESPAPTASPSPDAGGAPPPPPRRGFFTSIPPAPNVATDPTAIVQSLFLAVAFLLLAAFPGQLFNKTLEENYDEIVGWFGRGGRLVAGASEALSRFWKRRSGVISFVVASALLYGFLDPAFGPTSESLALLVGILAGLAVVIASFELPVLLFQRRTNGDRGRIRVQPLTIVVAVVCVLLSRIADFQPGYLYGLVAGYAFVKPMSRRDEGRAAAFTCVWMLLVALAAWLALPVAESAAIDAPLLGAAVGAALATVFIGGLEGLLFELVPLRFLRGARLFAWRRSVWAVLFVVSAFLFAHILLTSASGYLGDTRESPLLSAVVLFVGFAIVSIAFWGYFRFRPTRVEPAQPGPV